MDSLVATTGSPAKLLWTPKASPATPRQIDVFQSLIASKYSVRLDDYASLHQWSIDHISSFWAEVWEFTGIVSSRKWDTVVDESVPMDETPTWFAGAKLNWAENMLRCRSRDKIAVVEVTEPPIGEPAAYRRISYFELYQQVHFTALSLAQSGLKPGSILAYYGPNSSQAVILLLAASSLGTIWSSASSDSGSIGVLERFAQFGDALWGIVGVESVRYNGKVIQQRKKLDEVVEGLQKVRSGQEALKVIVFDYLKDGKGLTVMDKGWMSLHQVVEEGRAISLSRGVKEGEEKIDFYQAAFDHPLWVLFSSGTTGIPKPIVHRAGGMLIQSLKEHMLQGDMGPDDVFYYFSTTSWMMFNYLVAGLSTSCTVVLFDGSPLLQPSLLWKMVDDLGITVFGTSAKYIDVLSKNYSPKEHHRLDSLKQILSTGSPLRAELYEWIYANVKTDVLLGSITGGTDICSLFASHCVSLPVYSGEIQCLALGMAIKSFSEEGVPVAAGTPGDLVCVKAFPCAPIYFWNDVGGKRYRSSYYEGHKGAWTHGDYCIVTPSQGGNGGGLLMLGRSDGVLNPSGVRFGSSELYEVLDTFAPTTSSVLSTTSNGTAFDYNIIEDSLAVGQKTDGGSDERVVLFVKMVEGRGDLNDTLTKEIKLRIRTRRSARHVPERILQVADIPHTVNGKKVEIPIKKLINGATLEEINARTLRNPECLDEFVKLGEMLRAEVN